MSAMAGATTSNEAALHCHPIQRIEAGQLLSDGRQVAAPDGLAADLARITGERPDCMSAEDIRAVMRRWQDGLVERGWTTSRVLAPPQDMTSRVLELLVLPGQVGSIRTEPADARILLSAMLPLRPGDLLDLRVLEQAVENLQRLPTVEAKILMHPGDAPGVSDLEVLWSQDKPWRLVLGVDNSGSRETGRYQGSTTLALDNPLAISDRLQFSGVRDLGGGIDRRRGNRSTSIHYSAPVGHWLLNLDASRQRHHQNVIGATTDYSYNGRSQQQELGVARTFWRSGTGQTRWSASVFARQSENFIDDTEVEVQRRRVGGWKTSLGHEERLGAFKLAGQLQYRRGTKALGGQPAPEEAYGEGSHFFQVWNSSLQLDGATRWAGLAWTYQGEWRRQIHRSPLTQQDRFSLGGQTSVRGFDGEQTLAAERGWLVRQEVGVGPQDSAHQAFAAFDQGRISGPSAQWLAGQALAGTALGVRGRWTGAGSWTYELSAGRPVRKPEALRTAPVFWAFSLQTEF
ncbi:ShlB/FhaC/HecB family hemolysin secretion/activation protein [uncultured Hydrogenophaga sp.]|uniref:ShlB/FhaC/HecB family hemolysin secretion/activation protein n=1 Tax=uncultured Hydrogenophaga sp. TaxID=199683 RepID=UPI00265FEB8A|nr:ShlB/FhaC/HecB family hemolysin secretion/activation protein [uncultured Hydrogenophaga sp.]